MSKQTICVCTILFLAANLQAVPGLIGTFSDGKYQVRRAVVSPNFTLAKNESVHSQIAPAFEAVYTGQLKIARGGKYTLLGAGRIEVGGKEIGGQEVMLAPGTHALKISVKRQPGPARFQLRWKSDFFIEESVPNSAFESGEGNDALAGKWAQIEHGRELYESLSCGACHGNDAWHLTPRRGPALVGVGSRLNEDWLRGWLKAPHRGMPQLLANDGEVADVAAFLKGLSADETAARSTANPQRIESGREIFNRIGCAQCHTEKAHSLAHVGLKYRSSQALAVYLLDPSGRMPRMFDPKSQSHEAALVAEFLFHTQRAETLKGPGGGDAAKGRRLVLSRGCVSCHSAKENGQPILNGLKAPMFAEEFDAAKGCLAETPKGAKYSLGAVDRASLRAFLQSMREQPVVAKAPVEKFHRQLKQLNCASCHEVPRAGLASDGIVAVERPPSLAGAGDKLRVEWIRRVLTEGKRTRPWLKLRMPDFGGAVAHLPEMFPAASGSLLKDSTPKPELELAKKGIASISLCVTCHDYGGVNRLAESVVPAPDLAEVGQTLRAGFFRRWIHDPQRIRAGTSMPQFFTELKGAARDTKIAELWAAMVHQENLPVPDGLLVTRTEGTRVVVGNDPVILRVATVLPPNVQVDRAINVGLPGRKNFMVDGATGQLRGVWFGDFLNAAAAWNGRGGKPVKVVAEKIHVLPDHLPIRIGDAKSEPTVKFLGYHLDARYPVFRYAVDGVEVHERIELTDTGLTRRFAIAQSAKPVFFVDDKEGKSSSEDGKFAEGVLKIAAGKDLKFAVDRPLSKGQTVKRAKLKWIAAGKTAPPASQNGGIATVLFENQSGQPVKLVWIGYDGGRRGYGTLAPGATRRQGSYSNNVWLITDVNDKPLGHFVAVPDLSTAIIPKLK